MEKNINTSENEENKKESIFEELKYEEINIALYPTIPRRYFAMFIDGMILLIWLIILSSILGDLPDKYTYIRVLLFGIVFFLYEPYMVTTGGTIGHRLVKIRVRRGDNEDKNISYGQSILRFIVKYFLGIYSFLAILFTKNRRALHDMASNSIMINYYK